jgi:tetratricopeptide (TPR) repeat protein
LNAEMNKLREAGKLAEAVAVTEKALAIERDLVGPVHPVVAQTLEALAVLHEQREDFDAARKSRKEVLALRIQLDGAKHWRVTDARLDLADVDLWEKLDRDQRRQLREARSLLRRVSQLHWQGNDREAAPLAEKARRISQDIYGVKHHRYATAVGWVGDLYRAMGDYARAEPLLRQALDIRKQALGEWHPDYAVSLNNLAGLYNTMGDYARAEPLHRQARDIFKQALGEGHPSYAASLNNLAEL